METGARSVVAEIARGRGVVDIEMVGIAGTHHLVGTVEHHVATLPQEVDTKVALHVGQAEQAQEGGAHVDLACKVEALLCG